MTSFGSALSAAACLALTCFPTSSAIAQSGTVTVECHSVSYQYTECRAPLRAPQLIHQISGSPCILNRTWGFDRRGQRLWVDQGCQGVFADVGGYHHGRSGTFDPGSRRYDERGRDIGMLVLGSIAGAALSSSDRREHYSNYRSDTHTYAHGGYDGCHGIGCLVDPPKNDNDSSAIDTRPSFDKQGNPNFDTQGNWIGCHGVGCDVDPPSDDNN